MSRSITAQSVTLITEKILAPGETYIPAEYVRPGSFAVFGMDWDIEDIETVLVQIFQSNNQADAFRLWTSPSAAGEPVTNSVTISQRYDGMGLQLVPSLLASVRVTNNGAAPITIHRLTVFLS